jgi:hypothetical protein
MATSQEALPHRELSRSPWPANKSDLAAARVTLLGLLVRLWTAHGIFLNPDEALHFRLANQPTLPEAYRQSLTASHPPLLTFILYYWRAFGTSELCLRMPLILAGTFFCWMFYKWLLNAAGSLAAFVALLFVAFLPPIVTLSIEIRQYPLLLAFLAASLYFLDQSFAKNSVASVVAFALFLYLAMLSHYSAFLFAAALGLYALLRIFRERQSARLISVWAIGQLGAAALALLLYKTHIAKLGVGESRTVLQGWMSEFFLRRSYFDPAHDNPVLFLLGHSFGVFQFFFGQLVIGDVMGLLFLAGVALLLRGSGPPTDKASSQRLGIFLLLPFSIAAAASLAHVYPFGGTRHIAFLIIPAITGVSVAIARLSREPWTRALGITAIVLLACIAFGKARLPRMSRADQSSSHMAAAIDFLNKNVAPSDVIFTDYQGDLILGHYLCWQRPIMFTPAPPDFENFSCAGHPIVSLDYKTAWVFTAGDFPAQWRNFVKAYGLKSGSEVWIVQMGWDATLPEELRKRVPEFRDLQFESFGNNIKIFRLTVRLG